MGGHLERLRFRQAPLLAATIWFALGEVMARSWRPGVVLLLAVLLMVGVCVWALREEMRVVLVPVAGLWMVVGIWCVQVRPVPSPQKALIGYADNLSREVRGHVVRVRALPPRVDASDADTDGWRGDQDEEAAAAGALQMDVEVDGIEHLTPDISEMVPMVGGVRATLIADDGAAGAPMWRQGGGADADAGAGAVSGPGRVAVRGLPAEPGDGGACKPPCGEAAGDRA